MKRNKAKRRLRRARLRDLEHKNSSEAPGSGSTVDGRDRMLPELPEPADLTRYERLAIAFDEALEAVTSASEQRIGVLEQQSTHHDNATDLADFTSGVERSPRLLDATDEELAGRTLGATTDEELGRTIDAMTDDEPARRQTVPLGVLVDGLFARLEAATRAQARASIEALQCASEQLGSKLTEPTRSALVHELHVIREQTSNELAEYVHDRANAEVQLAAWIGHARAHAASPLLAEATLERIDEWITRISEVEVIVSEYELSLAALDVIEARLARPAA